MVSQDHQWNEPQEVVARVAKSPHKLAGATIRHYLLRQTALDSSGQPYLGVCGEQPVPAADRGRPGRWCYCSQGPDLSQGDNKRRICQLAALLGQHRWLGIVKPAVSVVTNVVQQNTDTRTPEQVKAHLVDLQRAVLEECRRFDEQQPQQQKLPPVAGS
jgi:hypothetical protein